MITDYHELLTTRIFHEQRPATYSWLGRTLDVQINEAKCMLYEFHQSRLNNTDGKPSCEAVYCVAGRPRKLEASTPTPSNSQGADTVPARIAYSYVLTPEADLEATKERFRTVISVHIWSLQAKIPLASDLLVGVRVEERSEYARSDLAEEVQAGQAVSGIAVRADGDDAGPNPVGVRGAGVKPHDKLLVVQLNDGNQTKPVPFQAAAKAEPKQVITSKPAPKMSPTKTAKCNGPDTSEAATGKAKLPGGFFKAQGKKKAAAKTEPTPGPPPEEVINSDEEPKHATPVRASRRRLAMESEESDGSEDDSQNLMTVDPPPATEPKPAPQTDSASRSETAGQATLSAKPTAPPVGGNGHRRRKVTKTKTYTDAKGYLVTEDVAEWESYSEDEEQPEPSKKSKANTPPK